MRTILILSLILTLSGCSRWCAKHYASKDSVSYIEKVKFDTVNLVIPSDTTLLVLPMDCPDKEITTENSKQKVKIIIKDRILTGEFICKEDSLKKIIQSLETRAKEVKTIERKVYTTPFYTKILLGFLVLLSLFFIYLFIKRI